jgi:hypothetical protein
MAKAQFPIDGKLGKDFKATSLMGMRIHPVTKVKKHHNGTDIWAPKDPCWIEAPYDGKVVFAGPSKSKNSDGSVGGFGYYVILIHSIGGKFYTSLYAHLQKDSLKVKTGQKITAGTPMGKMGTTGMSTGKHLHWELRLGKQHIWDANGKNYIEPIAFFKALIAMESSIATAPVTATENDDVAPEPTHGPAPKVVAKPAAAAKATKPALKGTLKKGSKNGLVTYLQNSLGVVGDTPGLFGERTHLAVVDLQKKGKLKADGIVGPLTWGKVK